MDMVKDLVETVKSELSEISSEHSIHFFKWMKDEYVNYMLISRAEFLATLIIIETDFPYYIPYVNVLKKHINEYGSIQAYYRASLDLLNL